MGLSLVPLKVTRVTELAAADRADKRLGMSELMEVKRVFGIELLPTTLKRADIRLDSLVLCHLVFLQRRVNTLDVPDQIRICKGSRALRASIPMISAMANHVLSEKPGLREGLSTNGTYVLLHFCVN